MTKTIFICTDKNQLKDLGFEEEAPNHYTYYNGISRSISIYKKDEYYYIQFIHYSHIALKVFKKMIELGIVEEKEIPYFTRDYELNKLRKRIDELERKINND